jgi:uncharacterized membrane protein YeaQ/YmgE (transglycosylase-associated protein family)
MMRMSDKHHKEVHMGTTDWVMTIILGGILGMVGQGIRVIIGLKKMNETAAQEGKKFSDLFQGNTLGLSLLIGFIAGALAMVGISNGMEISNPSKEIIVTIIGAGYAGTDFIEGFIKKNMPSKNTGEQANAKNDEIEQPAVG